ncbi:hypothetical protein LOTGIDRAFT_239373 [Lottia gigantea]|uniref:PSP proline-rich domain-containing protein n=1 Tax=Lottia gigantea TaxID=225164 RepID=V4AH21_LOTGI|nr:hypothetical protein LOTGIDRAFT_239373 [Lottia gigantea]ESO96212.1 hypothetical protein LOTGIDRAFT_239373 [Lottia gigantea]
MWDAHAIIGNAQFHEGFMVDSRGWPITPNCQQQELIMDLILFEKLFEVPLPVDEADLSVVKREKRKKAACFNCDGEHNLSECPQPKDFNKIGANRRKFQDSKVNSVPKLSLSKNYSDFEDDPRFQKFKPGQISNELYSAMGITPSQLPLYIYKMRVLGYPPGWLVRAKKGYSSGIVIFDKDGRETNLKGETLEDGELNADREKEEDVELEKIIEYPGFTVPPAEEVHDDHERLNMPPLQPHQLKLTLERHVSVKEEFKKRKAEEEAEMEKKRICIINKEADMEMSDDDDETSGNDSDFRPPLPVDTPPGKPPYPTGTSPITPTNGSKKNLYHPTPANLTPPHFGAGGPPLPDYTPPARPPLPEGTPPPTPPVLNQRGISAGSGRSDSPTFESLQNKYEDILKQLNEDSSSQSDSDVKIIENPDEDSDASVIFVPELENQESNVSEVSASDVSVRTLSRASSTLSIQSLDDSVMSRGSSKVKVYGTPILESSTTETALPSSENFKVGTEEHLMFENLPGATGTFSKMRKLLDKIKTKIKK